MTSGIESGYTAYTSEQVSTWLKGLLTIAWADGDFTPQEKTLIEDVVRTQLAPDVDINHFQPLTAAELAASLGQNPNIAENFLRTAVMVALADGTFSSSEDEMIREFHQALGLEVSALETLKLTMEGEPNLAHEIAAPPTQTPDVLHPVREWLNGLDIADPQVARFLCKMIPAQCPFERDIVLFGHKIVHIPPLCKLNPLYEQLVGLRFRALSYLADECQEDVTTYC